LAFFIPRRKKAAEKNFVLPLDTRGADRVGRSCAITFKHHK
jgi:hypothetical protein